MTKKNSIQKLAAGCRIGRWTVLDERQPTERGETKWLCRCACGTQRYVLERSLQYGGSQSCGCLKRERSKEKNAYDLTGQVFGDLKVLHKASNPRKNGGVRWLCQCACGKNYETYATLLVTGKRTHCGCRDDLKKYAYSDISGKKYGRLTALYPTEERNANGSIIWHCRCDCGNEVDVSMNTLVYTGQMSCGCQKKEHDQILSTFLTHVDGTSIDMLRSKKTPVNNTTGVRGVYLIRGKYVAKIVLQKKAYYLGNYDTFEKAAEARREADEIVAEQVVKHYEMWKACALADPEWAESFPASYDVEIQNGRLQITSSPSIEEIQSALQKCNAETE